MLIICKTYNFLKNTNFCIQCFIRTNITSNGVNAEIKIRMPHTSTEGYYRTEGRFNNIKIKSKGFYNVSAGKDAKKLRFKVHDKNLKKQKQKSIDS